MKLVIISHTEHYKTEDGQIVGLGSTVTEINHLLDVFDSICHVAMLHDGPPSANSLPYLSDKVQFVPIPVVGGSTLFDKLNIVWNAPRILHTVRKALNHADYFQFRAPTGIGVFVIPYLVWFHSAKGWFKYAGNWKQHHPPLAYAFQRWLLKRQRRNPVTINGSWPDQLPYCLTFENPCLSNSEAQKGKMIRDNKSFNNSLIDFCFVGRLEEAKGMGLLIRAISHLKPEEKALINCIHIVGQGKDSETYINMAKSAGVTFNFHGFLSRAAVQEVYFKSHAIILASASEGFPKVIAEAMNFGCLPLVSNVSSIGHYIKDGVNGFLLKAISEAGLIDTLRALFKLSDADYKAMVRSNDSLLERFTYDYYNDRIKKEIIRL
ncbi:glycosyltransferase [Seonamhaeicola maritimus]|uniref:glycosyltransferase n=1 Tax=Seonamhaeicola maritimus TaxID=2591822 RepID=UPI002494AA2C|nr:glycosyltransferase [Seonamhaeicola maritimus]